MTTDHLCASNEVFRGRWWLSERTWLGGAPLGRGAVRPAAPAVAAALHLADQLRVLVGTAPVQQASVAVPDADICENHNDTKSVKQTIS